MLRGHQWISGIPVCVGLIRCGDAEEEKQQYGEQPEHGAAGRALKPHWGPLGSLARRFGPICSAESIHLLIVDEERKLNTAERIERELGGRVTTIPGLEFHALCSGSRLETAPGDTR